MATLNYDVPGVTCGHCKSAIESEVGQVPGVDRVEVDIASKKVVIEGSASEEAILAAIVEAGYQAVVPV